jgi:hypothetical protein
MKEQIKQLRVQIDGIHQLTKELKPINSCGCIDENCTTPKINSEEINDAARSLIYAKAWLGKVLGELGTENPYKSGYKTVADIEHTADTHHKINETHVFGKEEGLITEDYFEFNHIQKVDWLRQEIQKLIDKVKAPDFDSQFSTRELAIARTNAYTNLCNARFALGFELERIKKESEDPLFKKPNEV